MFVISVDEALELQLMSVAQEFEHPIKGIRYAQHLWKEVMAGCSFERACEAARKYFESPSDAKTLPLVVEKSGGFSLYLSDEALRESNVVDLNVANIDQQARSEERLQPTYRGRPISDSSLAPALRAVPQRQGQFRGRKLG
ncbi:MAG: hypothetical protein AB4050_08415 [Synechococcus sp.]